MGESHQDRVRRCIDRLHSAQNEFYAGGSANRLHPSSLAAFLDHSGPERDRGPTVKGSSG